MNGFDRAGKQDINDLDRARLLRKEAELLEHKESVRIRLRQLMEISKDPYYDRYLAQMMRDLESGKATPYQVEQEAWRSYNQYRQRMAQKESGPEGLKQQIKARAGSAQAGQFSTRQEGNHQRNSDVQDKNTARKSTVEIKIGIHVFSLIGAIFVLAAFVIFSFNFLGGLGQGLCLYGAALILTILSETLLRKRLSGFSGVITGIGIGGLYAANIANYLFLHTVNGIMATVIALLISAGTIFLSRRKNSAAVRLIGLAGCYISFLPVMEFETELNFLVITIILFIVNAVSIFYQNRTSRTLINSVHLLMNVIFTAILSGMAWADGINAVYLVLYIVTSFTFIDIFSLRNSAGKDAVLYPLSCVGGGICLFLLFFAGNFAPGMSGQPEMALFVHLEAEILVAAVCSVIFLLWDKEDGRKWAQIYYAVGVMLLLGSFSEYHLEIILTVLIALLIVKLTAGHKELLVLDCIAVTWTGILGLWLSDYWYCWLFAGMLLLSVIRIKQMHIYHEIVITLSVLAIWWSQCTYYLRDEFGLNKGWLYPVSAGILLLFFFMFNHLPWLKIKKQKIYNIADVIFMLLYYLGVWQCDDYVFSSVMMILGAVTILIVFRKRYGMEITGKYLILTGFLTYFALTGHYESPIIVSVLLMAIALACVGIGFKLNDRAERVSGLIMAVFVCLKLVIYDFKGAESVYRVIVCLAAGAMALIISFIYLQLEKNAGHHRADEAHREEICNLEENKL